MTGERDRGYATAVIVAAGRGERFGHPAKVLEQAGGKPLLTWSMLAAMDARSVREVIVVTGEHTARAIQELMAERAWAKPISLIPGGARRQDSVACGIEAVGNDREVVLVHDAARPLAPAALFDACAGAARAHGAAIVATPVPDTLKRVNAGTIAGTVSREGLWAAQTPQGFRLDVIRSAIERTRDMIGDFTDEASLLEALGEPVWVVAGNSANLKVTHRDDLELADALLKRRRQMDEGRR